MISRTKIPSFVLATLILLITVGTPMAADPQFTSQTAVPKTIVLFYLNGDNDLGPEVLHALDMIETVGAGEHLKVLALVDGNHAYLGPYGSQWQGTRLLEIQQDEEIGTIRSTVLADYGELDLGANETLENFVRYGCSFKADRYIFAIFAHGRGIIDTHSFSPATDHKRLSLSSDSTTDSQLSLTGFHAAIQRGLNGRRFDAMVFFTCLANMVEIAYELQDVTDYLVASPDEIRIVNQPPGRFQIRGIPFEQMLTVLNQQPAIDTASLAKMLVDDFIKQYAAPINISAADGVTRTRQYAASLALIDCRTLPELSRLLNHLATILSNHINADPNKANWLQAVNRARVNSRRYPSFLDLEYYNLVDLLTQLAIETQDQQVGTICQELIERLDRSTIVYERHTANDPVGGLSIYFSHSAVPDNIFNAHQAQYRLSRFSAETRWDELVEQLHKVGRR